MAALSILPPGGFLFATTYALKQGLYPRRAAAEVGHRSLAPRHQWISRAGRDRLRRGLPHRLDYGADSLIQGVLCRWFDYWLKGKQNGIMDEPPVHVFVMGENRWHQEKD